jgi:hypothetical protein
MCQTTCVPYELKEKIILSKHIFKTIWQNGRKLRKYENFNKPMKVKFKFIRTFDIKGKRKK